MNALHREVISQARMKKKDANKKMSGQKELLTVLSDTLLELEHEGLISKKVYPEIPPRVENMIKNTLGLNFLCPY